MKPSFRASILWLAAIAASPYAVRAQSAQAVPQPASLAGAAQTSADLSTNVDPEKEAAIRKLLDVTGAKSLSQQMIAQSMSLIRSSLVNSCGDNVKCQGLGNLVIARMQSDMTNDMDGLVKVLIPIYARHYSTDEINSLIEFYQTPLGQKMMSAAPQIALEAQKTSYAWARKVGADSIREVLHDHPEFASVAPPIPH